VGEKVVIDTNVMISGLGWSGAADRVLTLLEDGEFEFYFSLPILQEYLKVLQYEKFQFSVDDHKKILGLVVMSGHLITVRKSLTIVEEDPSDNKFLELAETIDADFFISGDKHLLDLKRHKRTRIVTPRALMHLMENN
jgi:putative PIN family toxin of toxin-antitoxin system